MKKSWLVAVGFMMVSSLSLFSQTDIKPKDTTLVIKYLISSDWTFTWGNLNSFITVNQGQLNIEQRIIGSKTLVRYRYGELAGITNYNEFYGNQEISFFPKNRVYAFVNGGAEFSLLRGVNLRAWGGAGAGFKVVNNDDHKFEPIVSFNYEYNNYSTPILYRGDSTMIVHTGIANVGWTGSHKFFRGRLVLAHNFLYTQDLLYADNFKFNGGFNLSVPIIRNLMVKTSLLGSFQNVVPADKKQGDLIWTIGVAWGNL